jgi:hypothetical protein
MLLTEEETSDQEMRSKFPDRWNRPLSSTVNKLHRSQVDEHTESFKLANNTNETIKKKIETYYPGILALSAPEVLLQLVFPVSHKWVQSELELAFVDKNRGQSEDSPLLQRIKDVNSRLAALRQEMDNIIKRLDEEGARSIGKSHVGCFLGQNLSMFCIFTDPSAFSTNAADKMCEELKNHMDDILSPLKKNTQTSVDNSNILLDEASVRITFTSPISLT